MTREILFKALTKDDKKLIYGIPIKADNKHFMVTQEREIIEIIEDSICEFTNKYFYEKEDEKIWENDVILYQGKEWTVLYCEELCGFQAVAQMDSNPANEGFKFFLPLNNICEGKFIKNNKIKKAED